MITKEMEDKYYHLLRREGYINGQYAAANTIETFMPLLKEYTAEEFCTALMEAIREYADDAAKELEEDRERLKEQLRQELKQREQNEQRQI